MLGLLAEDGADDGDDARVVVGGEEALGGAEGAEDDVGEGGGEGDGGVEVIVGVLVAAGGQHLALWGMMDGFVSWLSLPAREDGGQFAHGGEHLLGVDGVEFFLRDDGCDGLHCQILFLVIVGSVLSRVVCSDFFQKP